MFSSPAVADGMLFVGSVNYKIYCFGSQVVRRDISLINVSCSTEKACAGQAVSITVQTKNNGTEEETFQVTTYYDSSPIGTKNVTNLSPNGIATLTFSWDTTHVPPGNYTIRAEATTVPNETNTANNQLTNGMIQIIKHPIATFVYTATIVNQQVTFDATKSEPNGGQITDYLWDFEGDGIFDTTGPIVNHTYTSTGWQIPNLVIIDTEELTNFTWWGIYVTTPDETYNIAVTDVTPSKNIVTQGHIVNITVDITNTGSITTEIFDVTAYANTTIIDTLIDVALEIGNSTTLTIEWNTTDFAAGNYTIGATTSPFLSETDTTDNTYIDGTVTVTLLIPDVAVVDVTPSKTVVGQGYSMNITVTVENQGDYTESFNVTVYYDETAITLPNGKNHTTITLTSGNSTTINLTWNTTGVAKGNYTITAYAHPVLDETYTDDNTFTNGWVIVAMVGDITGPDGWPDGKCDMRDIGLVARHFGETVPPAPANCDLTGPITGVPDGKIDMRDIGLVARHFGETDP